MIHCCTAKLFHFNNSFEIFSSVESSYFFLFERNSSIDFCMNREITTEIGIFSAFIFRSFLSDDNIACDSFLSSEHLHSTILWFRISKVFCRSTGLFVCHYFITNLIKFHNSFITNYEFKYAIRNSQLNNSIMKCIAL